MKNLRESVILVLLLITMSFSAIAQKPITISGTIKNPSDAKVVVVNATSTEIQQANAQKEIALSQDGKFSITLPVTEKYNWIIIGHGRQRADFFAKEGTELVFSADARKYDSSLAFEGKDNAVPMFFSRYTRDKAGIMSLYRRMQEIAAGEPAVYQRSLDSLKQSELDYLEMNKSGLPKDFIAYWKDFVQFASYDAMLNYPSIHEMIKQQSYNIQNIPPALYEVTKKTPKVLDDKQLGLMVYQNYAQNYYPAMLTANGFTNTVNVDQDRKEDRSKALQQTDSVLHLLYTTAPPKTAELVAGRMLAAGSKGWTLEELEQRIAGFERRFPKSKGLKTLKDVAGEIKKFNPGQPAVDFSFKTMEGKEMKLSDLKGKVVYMDFWASWCGPCKGEMPHAKKLKEQFQGKDVVFLYVSIDENEAAWKKGIEAMSISGVHTRTSGWGGEIAKMYKIESVPAYYLIDKKGNFVLKRTPRPSQSAELTAEIEKLLQ
jgi:thiol-disulfide isomerase/thioredoxin